MKRALFGLIALVLFLVGPVLAIAGLAGCSHAPPPPAPVASAAPAPKPLRSLALTLHGEDDFSANAREEFRCAVEQWRAATQGRVAFDIVYDLDLEDSEDFAAHFASKDAMLIGVESDHPIVVNRDTRSGVRALAWTSFATEAKPLGIFVVVDRIRPDRACQVLIHELGHVLGLEDLPFADAIMSAQGRDFPLTLTEADRGLCRLHRFCE